MYLESFRLHQCGDGSAISNGNGDGGSLPIFCITVTFSSDILFRRSVFFIFVLSLSRIICSEFRISSSSINQVPADFKKRRVSACTVVFDPYIEAEEMYRI
jgi:hypothetical protein